jgi:hypothetical protein
MSVYTLSHPLVPDTLVSTILVAELNNKHTLTVNVLSNDTTMVCLASIFLNGKLLDILIS